MAERKRESMFGFLSRFSSYISSLSIAFGGMVLIGWAFHIQRLKGIISGQVAVKANAAVCFVLIGLALWLAISGSRRRFASLLSTLLALLASFIGLLSFLEYWKGWDLGIDQLLFKAGPDDLPGSVRLALMSPLTAADFLLLGIAVTLIDIRSRWSRIFQNLVGPIAAVVSIFGILDFVIEPQYTHTHIAPMTALVLFLLSFAALVARAENGFGALLISTTVGGVLCRRLLPSAILIPIAIAWLRWKGQQIGLYSDWTGVAIMTVTSGVLLATLTVWTAFVVDRTEADRTKAEELARSLAAIVTCSNDAIIGKTLDGTVTSWNSGAEAIYGYSAEEMIGHPLTRIIPPDVVSEYEEFLHNLQRGESIRHHETELTRKDGKRIWVSVSISPLTNEKGGLIGGSTITRDISDRKQVEQKLLEASRYSRSLIEASLDPLVTISADGRITDVNRATEKATGLSRDRLIGSDFSTYFTEPEKARQGYRQAFASGFVRDYPLAIRNMSGAVMDVLYNATVFKRQNGEVEGVFAAARDVTERKQAEEALSRSESRYRSLVTATAQIVWTTDRNGRVVDDMPTWREYTGMTWEEIAGDGWLSSLHPDDRDRTEQVWAKAWSNHERYDTEYRIRRSDGEYRTFSVRGVPVLKNDGTVREWVGTCTDITERKRAEEALQTESSFRNSIIENAAEGLCVCRMTDAFPYVQFSVWNEQMRKITGFSMAEINRNGWYQTLYPDPHYQEQARERMFRMRDGDNLHAESWEITRSDGEKRLLQITTSVVTANDGTRHVLALMDDISDLRRAEQELRLSRERLALALKAGHSGTFDWDMRNNVNRWTPEVEEVHGLAPGEFGGTFEDWEALVLPADLPSAKACIESSLNTGEFVGEWRIRRRNDGQIRWITARAKILNDENGQPLRMIGVNIDVTERKQAEEEVRKLNDELEQRVIQRTAQLEAANKELEAFTYSVSHDLRAPLRHISGFSKILSEEFSASLPADAQHHLQRIQEGTRRMGQLVDDLLNLGRVGRKELSLQVAGLRSIIDDVIESLKSDVGDRQVEWKIGNLPFVECDTALIEQVFQNLLSNALKFTRPRTKALIEIGQEQRDGSSVVYVRDNGVGFSMKYADKLFGVFQRLHRAEDFEGTGVGLATVQRIIQKHGGRIWAEAELDKGAAFYFTLGASDAGKAASAGAQS